MELFDMHPEMINFMIHKIVDLRRYLNEEEIGDLDKINSDVNEHEYIIPDVENLV